MFGKIVGTGSYVPENIVTNNDLTKIVETSDSWIEERTGVKQRHLMKNETTATMATEAAKRAVENAGIKPEEIDDASMVIIARDVAKQIEKEMVYPGQIKVNVIRETRTVDFAR